MESNVHDFVGPFRVTERDLGIESLNIYMLERTLDWHPTRGPRWIPLFTTRGRSFAITEGSSTRAVM